MEKIIAPDAVVANIMRSCNGKTNESYSCTGCCMRNICIPGTHIEDFFDFECVHENEKVEESK